MNIHGGGGESLNELLEVFSEFQQENWKGFFGGAPGIRVRVCVDLRLSVRHRDRGPSGTPLGVFSRPGAPVGALSGLVVH